MVSHCLSSFMATLIWPIATWWKVAMGFLSHGVLSRDFGFVNSSCLVALASWLIWMPSLSFCRILYKCVAYVPSNVVLRIWTLGGTKTVVERRQSFVSRIRTKLDGASLFRNANVLSRSNNSNFEIGEVRRKLLRECNRNQIIVISLQRTADQCTKHAKPNATGYNTLVYCHREHSYKANRLTRPALRMEAIYLF